MNESDCLILFWLLPCLVTAFGALQYLRFVSEVLPSELDPQDWQVIAGMSVFYPVAWVYVMFRLLSPILTTEIFE